MLIYNTKFDIRQYFVITMANNKFQAWSHSACTIKFATEEFTLDTLSESVHITNVTVQKRYTRRKPNPNLPNDNAWSIGDLIKHFRTTQHVDRMVPAEEAMTATSTTSTMTSSDGDGEDEAAVVGDPCLFEHVIYPAIKKCLTCIAELSFDQIEKRNGRFELFGCDWLITENHLACLLEINRSPSMEYYTPKHVAVLDELLSDMVKGAYSSLFLSLVLTLHPTGSASL